MHGGNGSLMYGSAFGDYNHDGRLDLITVQWDLIGSMFVPGGPCVVERIRRKQLQGQADPYNRSHLYRNDGNDAHGAPHFTDVTKEMGLGLIGVAGFTPTFVDLNNDGWDDLVITSDVCTTQVFMNDRGQAVRQRDGCLGSEHRRERDGECVPRLHR